MTPDRPDTRVAGALTTLLTAGALTFVALDGGSFDLVVRQGAATFLWWVLALATLLGLTFRSRLSATGWIPVAAVVVLGAWTALSLGWTSSDELTLVELARLVAYLGVLVAVVFAVPADRWSSVVAGAALAAAVVCAVAVVNRLWPEQFNATVSIFPGDSRRLSAPFGYWNAVGAWAGMTSSLCLAWAAHAARPYLRSLAAAGVPVAIATSYLTYSRASLGGTVLGLLVLFLVSRNRVTLVLNATVAVIGGLFVVLVIRGHPEIANGTGSAGATTVVAALVGACLLSAVGAWLWTRADTDRLRMPRDTARRVVPAVGIVAVVAIAIAGFAVGPRMWDQFTTVKETNAADPAQRLTNLNGSRYEIWKVTLQEVQSPLHGSGAGTFEYTWNRYGTTGFVKDAHSLYLESLSELGVVGLLIVLAFVAGVLAALITTLRRGDPYRRGVLAGAAGAVAAYFFGAGVDWLWESPAVTVLAVTLAGAIVLAGARTGPAPSWLLRVPLVLAAVLMCLVQLPGLVSTSEVRKSQQALASGDVAAARRHADSAIEAQPWAASPFVQRALVDERAGAYTAAVAELEDAAQRGDRDWRTYVLLARVEAKRGNPAGAIAAFRRARELRPRSQFFAPAPRS